MRERRGAVARLAGLAEGVAAAARRRQSERAPRVLLYDASGQPRRLEPGAEAFDPIVSAAERMLELAGGREVERTEGEEAAQRSSTGAVSVPAAESGKDRKQRQRGGTRDKG